jgi:UDP-glucose 4-epimerase
MPSQQLILTGGRGRLATYLKPHLIAAGYDVISVSRTAGSDHISWDDLFMSGLLTRASVIIHAAWSTVPLISEQQVGMEWQVDLPLLVSILRELRSSDTRSSPGLFFFSSGGTVYGKAGAEASCEDDPLRPTGWHGFAKAAAEQLITEYAARTGLRFTILRISNPYGFPVVLSRPQGVIPHLVATAVNGREFTLWGDGTARKDYLHASDLASAVVWLIRGGHTGVFNLGAGASYSLREIIAIIETLAGSPIRIRHVPAPPWDVTDSRLDITKLVDTIGWHPAIDIETGLSMTFRDLTAGDLTPARD